MNAKKSVALLWLPLSLALLATGCGQDAPQAPAAPAADTAPAAPVESAKAAQPAEAAQTAPGTDAVVIEDHATPTDAAPGFDAKAFEGRYAAGQTTLDVALDGTFTLNDNGNAIQGTWNAQADGRNVLLDPDSKSEQDRRIEVVSRDSLRIEGGATLLRQKN